MATFKEDHMSRTIAFVLCIGLIFTVSGCCGKVKSERDSLKTQVESLKTEVNTLTATNANLNAQLGNLRKQIVDLTNENNKLRETQKRVQKSKVKK